MGLLSSATARREFDRFVASSTADLLRAGYLLTWNLAEAEDLVQETYLRTARRWPDVRKMDFPKAYARRVLFNLAIRENERRAKTRPIDSEDLTFDTRVDERFERRLLDVDARSDLASALALLPRRQRAVIVLRYYEDLSEIDIAQILGWPVGTVKSTASRALDELRLSFHERDERSSVPSFNPISSTQGARNDQSA